VLRELERQITCWKPPLRLGGIQNIQDCCSGTLFKKFSKGPWNINFLSRKKS
jgi:hypothetical protein